MCQEFSHLYLLCDCDYGYRTGGGVSMDDVVLLVHTNSRLSKSLL